MYVKVVAVNQCSHWYCSQSYMW